MLERIRKFVTKGEHTEKVIAEATLILCIAGLRSRPILYLHAAYMTVIIHHL